MLNHLIGGKMATGGSDGGGSGGQGGTALCTSRGPGGRSVQHC
jgi:hypothetical protein